MLSSPGSCASSPGKLCAVGAIAIVKRGLIAPRRTTARKTTENKEQMNRIQGKSLREVAPLWLPADAANRQHALQRSAKRVITESPFVAWQVPHSPKRLSRPLIRSQQRGRGDEACFFDGAKPDECPDNCLSRFGTKKTTKHLAAAATADQLCCNFG